MRPPSYSQRRAEEQGVFPVDGDRTAAIGPAARWITVLGLIELAALVGHALLSYGLAPVSPFSAPEPHEAELFQRLASSLAFLGQGVQRFVSGEGALTSPRIFLVVYCSPRLIGTAVFFALLAVLMRYREQLGNGVPRRLFLWCIGFGVACLPAAPAYFQDFWLSVAWGRMVAAGLNPYYTQYATDMLADLPLDYIGELMTYGPLWALISGAVVLLSGGSGLIAAALFKLLLGGAWIGSVWVIWRLLSHRSVWQQSVGIAVIGWLPLSVLQTVADGHNDIVMLLFMLMWVYGLQTGREVRASLSLAASVLVKYITAPLFLLDLLYLLCIQKENLRRYLPRALAAGALMAGVFLVFYRSSDFFAPLTAMSWKFFTPRTAAIQLEKLLGIEARVLPRLVALIFPMLALALVVRFVRRPDPDRFHGAILGVISAFLFGVVSHIWPWFAVWPLAAAALVPGLALSRWAVAVAVGATFLVPVAPILLTYGQMSLPLYTFTVLLLLCMPTHLFRA